MENDLDKKINSFFDNLALYYKLINYLSFFICSSNHMVYIKASNINNILTFEFSKHGGSKIIYFQYQIDNISDDIRIMLNPYIDELILEMQLVIIKET